MDNVNIDGINDIMTTFLDNVVKVAKIHTEYKSVLGDEHEYTKLTCSFVKIFNQYQELYVYINDQESFANKLVNLSNLVLKLLEFTPYELMKGNFFKKRKLLKANRPLREEAYKNVQECINDINEIINKDMNVEVDSDGTDTPNQESE